ncbi:hypothetical protein F0L68_22325 [Solihabitans fulvus]|uniref:Uncharacterized protein n=1 Tax=Solihabitans fulvus TaxID=1892852 RepID=A0A5B2X5T3_9PSEU|nr:hypothetical protein [Solihabitans fulvus]KAA2258593.1 hypothetical protein F0L68_22325 [Solihabitans fulvus]
MPTFPPRPGDTAAQPPLPAISGSLADLLMSGQYGQQPELDAATQQYQPPDQVGPQSTRPQFAPPQYGPSQFSGPPQFGGPEASLPPLPRVSGRRRGYLIKGLGLVAIAAVSGLIWLLFQPSDNSGTPAPTKAPTGQFAFTRAEQTKEPLRDSNCSEHAYSKVKELLVTTPCQQLTRALYETKTPDGETVYTSVSVVRMRSADDAKSLIALSKADGTGNISDLIRDNAVKIPEAASMKTLANGGYASRQDDRDVIIVESDTAAGGPEQGAHHDLMKQISADALRLGKDLTG